MNFQLNCNHCGEFISLDIEENLHNGLVHDEKLGEIEIYNLYINSGPVGSYESMDAKLTCPRCNYSFKSTVRSNFY